MSDALSFNMAKQILESSFMPIHCECVMTEDGKVSIRLHDAANITKLSMTGIASSRLSSIRGVAQIALEIKQALASSEMKKKHMRQKY